MISSNEYPNTPACQTCAWAVEFVGGRWGPTVVRCTHEPHQPALNEVSKPCDAYWPPGCGAPPACLEPLSWKIEKLERELAQLGAENVRLLRALHRLGVPAHGNTVNQFWANESGWILGERRVLSH